MLVFWQNREGGFCHEDIEVHRGADRVHPLSYQMFCVHFHVLFLLKLNPSAKNIIHQTDILYYFNVLH